MQLFFFLQLNFESRGPPRENARQSCSGNNFIYCLNMNDVYLSSFAAQVKELRVTVWEGSSVGSSSVGEVTAGTSGAPTSSL